MKITAIQIPPSTPEFRMQVAREATRVTIALSPCGKWQDIIAHRGKDLVYISTIPTTS